MFLRELEKKGLFELKNKKSLVVCLALIVVLLVTSTGFADSENLPIQASRLESVKFVLDGAEKQFFDPLTSEEQLPIMYNNRTYLPVRAIAELLGLDVDWLESTYDSAAIVALYTQSAASVTGSGYEWIVEPKFAYDMVFYDAACARIAAIVSGSFKFLDTRTGKISNEEHSGHGGAGWLVAVNKDGKYGVYDDYSVSVEFRFETIEEAIAELKKNFPGVSGVLPIAIFDTHEKKHGDSEDNAFYAAIEGFVYTIDGKLLADYFFDDFDRNQTSDNPAVCKTENGVEKWGFVNSKGEQIIDFVFDAAVSIDDETAFVKQDGKWGIIRKSI